ncbi:MAG: CvpA family protein [Oscillospiraceae bacterium]|nr:CvpA family protein [Oscillospiraceae bacterium]
MNISVMIDLAALGLLILFAALGWRRGLIRTLAELLVVILALVLSAQIAKAAAPEIVDRVLRPVAYEAIENRIEELEWESALNGTIQDGANLLVESIPVPFIREHALRLLEDQKLPVPADYTKTAVLELGRQAVDLVLDGVVRDLVRSILCTACFLILTFLFRLMVRVLRVVEKMPGVRQLNELGGALIGLGKGLILVCLCLWVLRLAGIITPEMAAGSRALDLFGRWSGGLIG